MNVPGSNYVPRPTVDGLNKIVIGVMGDKGGGITELGIMTINREKCQNPRFMKSIGPGTRGMTIARSYHEVLPHTRSSQAVPGNSECA